MDEHDLVGLGPAAATPSNGSGSNGSAMHRSDHVKSIESTDGSFSPVPAAQPDRPFRHREDASHAQIDAEDIRARAQADADELIREAIARADGVQEDLLAELDREVEYRLGRAEAEASSRLAEADAFVAELVSRARSDVAMVLEHARMLAEDLERQQSAAAEQMTGSLAGGKSAVQSSSEQARNASSPPWPPPVFGTAAGLPAVTTSAHSPQWLVPTLPSLGPTTGTSPRAITSNPSSKPQNSAATDSWWRTRTFQRITLFAACVLVAAYLIRAFVVAPYTVASSSMEPRFHAGDRVVVNKTAYWFDEPSRGEVVLVSGSEVSLDGSELSDETLMKRVIGLPGETIEAIDGVVYVEGRPIDDVWSSGLTPTFRRIRIPDDTVFVLGDNRIESVDSRAFGPVSIGAIKGRVDVVVWPVDRVGSAD